MSTLRSPAFYSARLRGISLALALACAGSAQALTLEVYDAPSNHAAVSTLANDFVQARQLSMSVPIATTGSDSAISYLCQAEALSTPRIAIIDQLPPESQRNACRANGVELVGEPLPWNGQHFIVMRQSDSATNGLARQLYEFALGRLDAAALAATPVPGASGSPSPGSTGAAGPGSPGTSPGFAPNPGTATGSWFVITGSFPQTNPNEAKAREDSLRAMGFPAVTIDTNTYPNLTNGLYAVVLGPSDRATAEVNLNAIRGSIGDAYIKNGGL